LTPARHGLTPVPMCRAKRPLQQQTRLQLLAARGRMGKHRAG